MKRGVKNGINSNSMPLTEPNNFGLFTSSATTATVLIIPAMNPSTSGQRKKARKTL